MFKKIIPTIIVIVILLGISVFSVYYIFNNNDVPNISNETTNNGNSETNNENPNVPYDIPDKGNLTVIDTNVDTSIRVVNEFDETFTAYDKNLLIMFASWCPNCKEEISEIEKILNRYKNSKNINVVLIAHEYEDTITDLVDLIENDVNFGNIEVNLDLKRVIRKHIDPTASTIPISYVIDKKGNILNKHDDSLTLEKAIEMVEK